MQEPRKDKESRVFASFNDLREETVVTNKEKRLKGKDS